MCILLLMLLVMQTFAAPTSSTNVSITATQSTVRSITRSHYVPTIHHSPSHFTFPTRLTFTPAPPIPTSWRGPGPATNRPASNNPASIFFEVFGAVIGFVLVLGLTRCLYNYHKTPPPDRISGVVNRYHLQRELEELERNPFALRRPSLRDPAPPYIPKPPSYSESPSSLPPHGPEYAEVPSGDPPGSPITPRVTFEAATAPPNHFPLNG